MEFRASFSRFKKKVKQQLTGSKPKPDEIGTDASGARLDPTGGHSQSQPNLVLGSGYEADSDRGQVRSAIQLPQENEPEPAYGSVNDST